MSSQNEKFKLKVYDLVSTIPRGRIMTYGQIATLCGRPRAARIVGGIAHYGPSDLPWQRVVKKSGDLASGFPGGRENHKLMLENDGVKVADNYTVDVEELIWWPSSAKASESRPKPAKPAENSK
ncbi:methylated-DNA--[protein]-cysteine S-methyltransferase [Candidatus Saccharibacteria bacterium CPR2]|nr:methylated-DNA--[protein]-cysteine S-methyltransferase [Candidatus Saccharibacteria bacterium CPR2]